MNEIQPNKHARFESRYPAETLAGVRILLRQHIGLDPMPSYRSIARLIEATYPVKISGTTVKRMMDKLKCSVPNAPQLLNTLTPNDTNVSENPKVGDAYKATDGKSCSMPTLDVCC